MRGPSGGPRAAEARSFMRVLRYAVCAAGGGGKARGAVHAPLWVAADADGAAMLCGFVEAAVASASGAAPLASDDKYANRVVKMVCEAQREAPLALFGVVPRLTEHAMEQCAVGPGAAAGGVRGVAFFLAYLRQVLTCVAYNKTLVMLDGSATRRLVPGTAPAELEAAVLRAEAWKEAYWGLCSSVHARHCPLTRCNRAKFSLSCTQGSSTGYLRPLRDRRLTHFARPPNSTGHRRGWVRYACRC